MIRGRSYIDDLDTALHVMGELHAAGDHGMQARPKPDLGIDAEQSSVGLHFSRA